LPSKSVSPNLGLAWFLFALTVGLHVFDEAKTNFLAGYNPTVIALKHRLGWWPMPTFDFRSWFGGLIVFACFLLLLTPFMYRGARWMRPIAYFLVGVMILNALGHILFSILGKTVEPVHFPRPAPGFYSSPFLLAASIYLLIELLRTREKTARVGF
jgi:xanthine/uracil permease